MHSQCTPLSLSMPAMGIYAMTHIPTGHQYVGMSTRIQERWYEHLRALSHGRHWISLLQAAWDTDGQAGLTIGVLEHVTQSKLLREREADWLARLVPFFNTYPLLAAVSVPAQTDEQIRRCPRCGEVKALHGFSRDRNRRQGVGVYCLVCSRTIGKQRRLAAAEAAVAGAPISTSERERFWQHVDISGGLFACWPWLNYCTPSGHGQVGISGRLELAHRVAWMLSCGPIPDGACVLHNCPHEDNPACCNPAHLWLGDRAANNRDMAAKGRHGHGRALGERNAWTTHPERMPRGARHGTATRPETLRRGVSHHWAKRTPDEIREIRQLYDSRAMSRNQIARRFGCSKRSIQLIGQRKQWTHIE